MILFDLVAEVSVGVAFAASERERLRGSSGFIGERSFAAGLLFSALLYVPAMGAFVTLWPGWSAHYAFDLDRPSAQALFAAADAVALIAAYVGGFALAARAIRRDGLRALLGWLAAAWVVMTLLLFVVLAERSNAVTTYAGFAVRPPRGVLPPWGAPEGLLGGPVMFALVASAIVNGLPLALLYRAGRKRSWSSRRIQVRFDSVCGG